jgi:hypothetical protein
MDVASEPRSQHDRERRDAGPRTGTRTVVTLLIIAALCLLAILVATIGSLPPAPASEPVLLAPLRWS